MVTLPERCKLLVELRPLLPLKYEGDWLPEEFYYLKLLQKATVNGKDKDQDNWKARRRRLCNN